MMENADNVVVIFSSKIQIWNILTQNVVGGLFVVPENLPKITNCYPGVPNILLIWNIICWNDVLEHNRDLVGDGDYN